MRVADAEAARGAEHRGALRGRQAASVDGRGAHTGHPNLVLARHVSVGVVAEGAGGGRRAPHDVPVDADPCVGDRGALQQEAPGHGLDVRGVGVPRLNGDRSLRGDTCTRPRGAPAATVDGCDGPRLHARGLRRGDDGPGGRCGRVGARQRQDRRRRLLLGCPEREDLQLARDAAARGGGRAARGDRDVLRAVDRVDRGAGGDLVSGLERPEDLAGLQIERAEDAVAAAREPEPALRSSSRRRARAPAS